MAVIQKIYMKKQQQNFEKDNPENATAWLHLSFIHLYDSIFQLINSLFIYTLFIYLFIYLPDTEKK